MQEKNLQRDIKNGTPTFRKQENGTIHEVNWTTQKTPIREVLAPHETRNEDNGHQTLSAEF